MQNNNGLIYKTPRIIIGYTQEVAAELLYVSVESVRAYELGKTVPGNDVVIRMCEVYRCPGLAYQHLLYSSEIARQCLRGYDVICHASGIAEIAPQKEKSAEAE